MTRRWLWLLLLVPLAVGLARLRFDADVLNLLPPDLPAVQGLQLHQRHFANSRQLLITLGGDDAEQLSESAKAIAQSLASQTSLVRTATWQPPWLENPGDAAENLAWLWCQQSPAELTHLLERLSPPQLAAQLQETREALAASLDPQALARTSYDPLALSQLPGAATPPGAGFDQGTGIFISEDGRFRTIYVEPANPRMNYTEAAAWLAQIRAETARALEAAQFRTPNSELRISYTGGPAFLAEIATGMENDLRNSVLTTLAVIALLFWLAHRSLRPLLWLLAALGVTLVGTLALGGLVFGTLNVVSAGFAAVMLGLAVDYGLVGYQESRANPGETVSLLRRRIAKGVGWSAATTAGTFLVLRFVGLPGLAQLGALTAMGLALGAVVMLYGFLPLAVKSDQRRSAEHRSASEAGVGDEVTSLHLSKENRDSSRRLLRMPEAPAGEYSALRALWPTAAVLLIAMLVLLWRGLPSATASTEPLRPRNSAAYDAMDEFKRAFSRTNEPSWILFRGSSPDAVGQQMATTETALLSLANSGDVGAFQLPSTFWPASVNAATNHPIVLRLSERADAIRQAALTAGFTTNSLLLTDGILAAWERWSQPNATSPLWPTNRTAAWMTGQFAARADNGDWLALGMVEPSSKSEAQSSKWDLPAGVTVTSWEGLGGELLDRVSQRVVWLTVVLAGVLFGSLRFAFRRWSEVLLSFAGLALSFLLLLAGMSVVGASWNLLNLVAIPLLLGSSVDSTIHMQLALRRHGSNRRAIWRSTGRALLLCAGANIAGFGSLAWSNNAGLASLDLVCAGGVACVFLIATALLPKWWLALHSRTGSPISHLPPSPSGLYRAPFWQLAAGLARILPRPICVRLAKFVALLYRLVRRDRFEVVVANLLPLVADDHDRATDLARRNFNEFATKLTDLWRYEAGVDVLPLLQPGNGWEQFQTALDSKRGVLLVTPHLGNWEFGAPLLARHGVRPLVLTAPEPGSRFTELRAAARSRHGIDTLVVGSDPFAFVQVIQRLQAGGVVALLVDRPPETSAAEVEFCGRPFRASIAAAELARTTGCVVLPVFVVHEAGGYRAHALPPVDYDRRALGSREARREFTGRILRVFEPSIRQFAEQWFHFVPVWKDAEQVSGGERERR
jgi:predicted RND superfamily exporter protein/predicted LPLAT superfamily acyltransferase